MQCSLFQSLVSQAVESHADAVSPEVRTHGTTCSRDVCRQQWAEYALLSRAVTEWRAGLPQVDLTERVLEELFPAPPVGEINTEAENTPALQAFVEQSWHDFRSPSQRPWAIALSVAGLMLWIGTWMVSIPPSRNADVFVRPRNNPRLIPPPTPQWASRLPQSSSVAEQSPNVAVQSVEWAQKASSVMAQTIVSIPERGAAWVPSDSWDVNWQHKLEPIRRDAHAAWDALLEEIPMLEQPSS